MEYWIWKTDDTLILISYEKHIENRSHYVKPSIALKLHCVPNIPLFQYSIALDCSKDSFYDRFQRTRVSMLD